MSLLTLQNFPLEIVFEILRHLNITDIVHVRQVCHFYLMMSPNNALIRNRSVDDSIRHLTNELFGSTVIINQTSFCQKGLCHLNQHNDWRLILFVR